MRPQNKFELKLPLAADWNDNFFFYACGGFCGSVRPAQRLWPQRGYASATGNGGHDSAPGFDGIWAANAPGLQEDFGWRSNHVVTLITKAITTLLRPAYPVFLYGGQFKGRSGGPDGGAALPGRLRWFDA